MAACTHQQGLHGLGLTPAHCKRTGLFTGPPTPESIPRGTTRDPAGSWPSPAHGDPCAHPITREQGYPPSKLPAAAPAPSPKPLGTLLFPAPRTRPDAGKSFPVMFLLAPGMKQKEETWETETDTLSHPQLPPGQS